MTSKEAFESLRQEYFLENGEQIIVFKGDDERLNIIEKDLEILEEIRDYFKVIDYGEEYQNRYALQIGYPYPEGTIIPINKELYLKWKRWLNNEK